MPLSLEAIKRLPVLGLVRGPGRHRPSRPAADRQPLFPPDPHPAGVVSHGFRHCKRCGTDTVAILHREGHTCGDCGRDHYTEDGDQ